MMQSILNIREEAMRQWERDRRWREMEAKIEMDRIMYAPHPGYRVEFKAALPEGKVILMDNILYVPESQCYKWIFFNNEVNDRTVKMAVDYAIAKVNRFIDNYKA